MCAKFMDVEEAPLGNLGLFKGIVTEEFWFEGFSEEVDDGSGF